MTFKSQRWQFTITNLQRAINLRQRSVNLLFSPPCICSKLKYLFTEGSIILQYMFLYIFYGGKEKKYVFHLLRAFAESWNAFSLKTPTGWPDAPCICSKGTFQQKEERSKRGSRRRREARGEAEGRREAENANWSLLDVADIWNSRGKVAVIPKACNLPASKLQTAQ